MQVSEISVIVEKAAIFKNFSGTFGGLNPNFYQKLLKDFKKTTKQNTKLANDSLPDVTTQPRTEQLNIKMMVFFENLLIDRKLCPTRHTHT